jgi:hypothetical protein
MAKTKEDKVRNERLRVNREVFSEGLRDVLPIGPLVAEHIALHVQMFMEDFLRDAGYVSYPIPVEQGGVE